VLLAGRGKLEEKFVVKALNTADGLAWVVLSPKSKESSYEAIRVGFESGKLARIETVDGFGHTTRVSIRSPKENTKIDPARFTFTPPKGVDVIGD
jgi:outer membrane lipoprotein-sorting protein